jgi:hypothetical protein
LSAAIALAELDDTPAPATISVWKLVASREWSDLVRARERIATLEAQVAAPMPGEIEERGRYLTAERNKVNKLQLANIALEARVRELEAQVAGARARALEEAILAQCSRCRSGVPIVHFNGYPRHEYHKGHDYRDCAAANLRALLSPASPGTEETKMSKPDAPQHEFVDSGYEIVRGAPICMKCGESPRHKNHAIKAAASPGTEETQ